MNGNQDWTKYLGTGFVGAQRPREDSRKASAEECAKDCLAKQQWCKSFDYVFSMAMEQFRSCKLYPQNVKSNGDDLQATAETVDVTDHYEFYYEAPSEVNEVCTHKQGFSYSRKVVNDCFLLSGQESCLANTKCWFNGRAPAGDTAKYGEFLKEHGETEEEIVVNADGYMVQVKREFPAEGPSTTLLLGAVMVAILLSVIIICILCYFLGAKNRVHDNGAAPQLYNNHELTQKKHYDITVKNYNTES